MEKKKNKKYIQGRNHEQELKRSLESVGFPLVMRSAGSKGPVDIIAVGYNDVYMFQCKSTEYTVVTDEMVQQVFKTKRVKDLTNLPSKCIKLLTFRAKGDTRFIVYRWMHDVPTEENNYSFGEWKYIENKLF